MEAGLDRGSGNQAGAAIPDLSCRMLRFVTQFETGHRTTFAVMTAVNVAVSAIVLACVLLTPGLGFVGIISAMMLGLALTGTLALARRQGRTRDEVAPTAWQWVLFVGLWAGTLVWFVAACSARLARSGPVTLESMSGNGGSPQDERWGQGLDSLAVAGESVALVCWLVLIVHLSMRVGGRRSGRATPAVETGLWSRWPDLVYIALIPGSLAIFVWVANAGGSVNDTGWDGLGYVVVVGPVLFILLAVIEVQTLRTAWAAPGASLTTKQASLQLGMWVSLLGVGAGVTLTTMDGREKSVVLDLLPGAASLSHALAWAGMAGFLATYVLLLISLRARRRAARKHARHVARRPAPAQIG